MEFAVVGNKHLAAKSGFADLAALKYGFAAPAKSGFAARLMI